MNAQNQPGEIERNGIEIVAAFDDGDALVVTFSVVSGPDKVGPIGSKGDAH